MKMKLLIGGLLFMAAIAISFAFLSLPATSKQSLQDSERAWEERIRDVGGRSAYADLATSIERAEPEAQHRAAHDFGAALYAAEGTSGLAVCDDRFSYGCFHEFLGRAIADLGLGSINELNEGCFLSLAASPLSCQHGIGHGVVAFLGYAPRDLKDALDICRGLPKNDPIGGCFGGVFMEYNMRSMLGDDGEIREADDDLHMPCRDLSEGYKTPCYYWQPQWWHQREASLGKSETDIYKSIGQLCEDTGEQALMRACFEGVGTIIPPSARFDAHRAAELCDAASNDAKHRLFCLSLAANSLFVGGSGKKGDAPGVCASLEGEALKYCLSYASNASNILIVPELPAELRE